MNKKPTKVSADKTYLKHFSVPGFSQAQIMARAGKLPPESENFIAIVEGVYERVKSTKDGDWTEIEVILHSQIAMLNTLAANFMNKAIGGYESPEVLGTFPQLPLEFANLSLKCQAEMRKCAALLHEIKNPKKPATFIKNFVNKQLNQLQVEQEEIKQRLEANNHAPVDFTSKREAETIDTAVATVAVQHGASNARGQSD
ncbi:MAG: hypothetical protein RM368_32950 [Nostoc sp. DedSLP03]|uniref:hypothetical protein n=1 Tax=Nostoc sp. DedSLP03 TaxID=3075400 RepID=UPI002AD4CDAC|nr:hypothetical protein [Nostoc sp. DedSLP03]MDZ7969699.1 hypothetical protein [Nostoc sp. DedSLP03]